jgi:hypothetical protein
MWRLMHLANAAMVAAKEEGAAVPRSTRGGCGRRGCRPAASAGSGRSDRERARRGRPAWAPRPSVLIGTQRSSPAPGTAVIQPNRKVVMAAITGAMTTTNVLSDQLAIDLGDRINLLEPSAQPLAVLHAPREQAAHGRDEVLVAGGSEQAAVRHAGRRRDERRDDRRGHERRVLPAVGSGAEHPHRRAVPCRRGRGRTT